MWGHRKTHQSLTCYVEWETKSQRRKIKLWERAQNCIMGSVAPRTSNRTSFPTDQALEPVTQRGLEFPSLEVFKNHLDAILCCVLWDNPGLSREIGPVTTVLPSNLAHSVIQAFPSLIKCSAGKIVTELWCSGNLLPSLLAVHYHVFLVLACPLLRKLLSSLEFCMDSWPLPQVPKQTD